MSRDVRPPRRLEFRPVEQTRTRSARDLAAEQARSRPSTQFAQQYPTYPEQAQQLRRPPQQAPSSTQQFADLLTPAPRVQAPPPSWSAEAPLQRTKPRASVLRRCAGLVAFLVLTGMTLPLHILAVFFVYVQVESPADLETAAPLLGGIFVAIFTALFVVGTLTQLIGGFPGRWRARVVFAMLSAVLALGVAYAAAITQF